MRKTYTLICAICLVLLSATVSCQPQTPLDDSTNIRPTLIVPVSPTPRESATEAPLSSPMPTNTLPLNVKIPATPEWGDRKLLGKIVYVDRKAFRFVIVDANGDNPKEIFYIPIGTYEPYLGSPVKWSPDGKKIAFGCWKLDSPKSENLHVEGTRGRGTRLSLCVLNLVEGLKDENNIILNGLRVIELPEQYMPKDMVGEYINSRLFASLEWIDGGDGLVLTPFCIVMVNSTKTDCKGWGNLDHLDERNKDLLQKAYFIAPSPVDKNIWALTVETQILLMDLGTGEVNEINTEYENPSLFWSPDGTKMAVLTSTVVSLLDVQTLSFKTLMWSDKSLSRIEPELITALTGGYYLFQLYQTKNNIAWSPDGQYLALNVYLLIHRYDSYSLLYAGIFYYDLESGELFPARVNTKELGFYSRFVSAWDSFVIGDSEKLGLYVTPDWYDCNDPENVWCLLE